MCVWVGGCVCVRVQNISNDYEQILMKFTEKVERGPGRNRLDFGGGPVSFLGPGSFSRILYQ